MVNLNNISKNNKFFFLAYDQGLEHGPTDFNLENANPKFIFDLTKSGLFTGVITQKGIAEKYYTSEYYQTPLIIKLNGKTSFINDEPYSPQICDVKEALRLKAKAVGYTIYVGSKNENLMFKEFSNIVKEAHEIGIPVIGWMYPRGSSIKEETTDITAYAARVGLELGADIVKVRYTESEESMKWVVSSAGIMPVCIAGGKQIDDNSLKNNIKDAINAGCKGVAVGRNIWQNKEPLKIAREISDIIFN